jgi:integrase
MGSIYKRGEIYWIKYYRNGKPYRETTKSEKEADAKRLLKKREGEIAQGKIPGSYFDKIRFDELAEEFLAEYRINQRKSLQRAKISVAHLKDAFSGLRATEITTPCIQAYIETRIAERAARATINRELAALKRIFSLGARQTPPKVDKIPFIPMLKENNIRKGFFEHGDFIAIRDALPDYLKGFMTFAYKVGWRLSEIMTLTWNQVDLNQGIVRLEVGETKNQQGRTVYLDEELRCVFVEQVERRKQSGNITPFVFTNRQGKDRIRHFRDSWAQACKSAGLFKVGEGGKKIPTRLFHDFRRTAVRNMIRAGIPERVAMMITGHKTRSIFDRYNIVSDSDLRLAAARQEAYLQTQTDTLSGTIVDFRGTSLVEGAR